MQPLCQGFAERLTGRRGGEVQPSLVEMGGDTRERRPDRDLRSHLPVAFVQAVHADAYHLFLEVQDVDPARHADLRLVHRSIPPGGMERAWAARSRSTLCLIAAQGGAGRAAGSIAW